MPFHPEPRPLSPAAEQLRKDRIQLFAAVGNIFSDLPLDQAKGMELLRRTPVRIKRNEYEVTKPIGRGSYGAVVEAKTLTMPDVVVALKLSRAFDRTWQFADDRDAELARGLHREIAALKKITELDPHSAYPLYYEAQVMTCPGMPEVQMIGLVMEHINGENLEDQLDRHLLDDTPATMLNLAAQLTEAIALTHRAGFVHRDIKPNNIIIEPSGRLRLLDLGAVSYLHPKLARKVVYQNSIMGVEIGTKQYTRDEELGTYTTERDVYALGRTFQQFLAGIFDFQRPASRLKISLEHVHDSTRQGFSALADDMTKPDPTARPTIPQVLEKLTELESTLLFNKSD